MIKRFAITFVLIFISTSVFFGQKVTKVDFRQEGKKIIITYDLNTNKPANISVFCSTNGGKTFGKALKNVKGDVGRNIKPGKNKKIIFYDLSELNTLYSKQVLFKVKAKAGANLSLEIFSLIRHGANNFNLGGSITIKTNNYGSFNLRLYKETSLAHDFYQNSGMGFNYILPINILTMDKFQIKLNPYMGIGFVFQDYVYTGEPIDGDYKYKIENQKPKTNMGLSFKLQYNKFFIKCGVLKYTIYDVLETDIRLSEPDYINNGNVNIYAIQLSLGLTLDNNH